MVHMKLLKVSIGVQRYQVSFGTMFGLIWVEIWALESQKVFWPRRRAVFDIRWARTLQTCSLAAL